MKAIPGGVVRAVLMLAFVQLPARCAAAQRWLERWAATVEFAEVGDSRRNPSDSISEEILQSELHDSRILRGRHLSEGIAV